MVQDIRIEDFTYPLPEERIARYPLPQRDDSKLLVFTETTKRRPETAKFKDIADYLPKKSLVVFNETKVVPARLFFRKKTGALIEIFCLEPVDPADYQLSFAQTATCCSMQWSWRRNGLEMREKLRLSALPGRAAGASRK